jgi:glycosyltransferase involved in cell wall biosynthesis
MGLRIAYLLPSLDRKGPVIMVHHLVRRLKDRVGAIDVYFFNEPRRVEFPVATRKIGLSHRLDFSKYDIVHSHMLEPDFYVWKSGRHQKYRTVSTVHQFTRDSLSYDFSRPVSVVITPLWNLILKAHDCLVYISESLMNHSKDVIANPRSCFIHNGIESVDTGSAIPPEDAARIERLRIGHHLIGNFAHFTRRKGADQLIEMLAVCPEAALLLVGDGKELPGLVSLSRSKGVQDRCLFLGPRDDVQGYFRFLDVYAMTSRSEAFGLSLVEAVSAGVPIVCSDIATFRELFDATEVTFFELENIGSLKRATVTALAEKGEKTIRARTRLLGHYTAEKMAENYLALYNELAGVRG